MKDCLIILSIFLLSQCLFPFSNEKVKYRLWCSNLTCHPMPNLAPNYSAC